MSLPPILNRALNAAYEGANEIIQFSKRIDNLKVIKKGENDFTTNLDQYVEEKVFDNLKQYYPFMPNFSQLPENMSVMPIF